MFDVDRTGIISLSRGDSFDAPLFINEGTNACPRRYNLQEHPQTKIYFSVMQPNQPFEFGVIRKVYQYEEWQEPTQAGYITKNNLNSDGDIEIHLDTCDTLKLLPGMYYYSIKAALDGNDNQVNTIIEKTEFRVL